MTTNTRTRRSVARSVLVPVANRADARATASALEPYDFTEVTVLHVVEKGEGVPDKSPVEQTRRIAVESFAAFRETFPDADTRVIYRRNVVTGIIEVANEIDADSIAFLPRGGARVIQFLAGDRSLKLITRADRPVIALPAGPAND